MSSNTMLVAKWDDQPRAPKGTPIGGQWVDDVGDVASWVTPDEAQSIQDRMLANNPWTDSQKKALATYSHSRQGGYLDMNEWLRTPEARKFLPKDVENSIAEASAAMRPLAKSIRVARRADQPFGIEGDDEFPKAKIMDLVGQTRQDPGFTSTTLDKSWAEPSGLDVVMDIDVPAGTPAAYIRSVSENPDEDELLIAPGAKFLIREVTEVNGGLIIRAEVVP